MSLLKEATNRTAYLKAGFLGFGGAGKTTSAALVAVALSKLYGKHKAVAMLDTETGSDYLIPLFREHGIKFYPVKSRSLADLVQVFKEAEGTCDAVIVDSVSHVWREVCNAYKKRRKRTKLKFNDWDPIKEEWQAFTDAYVNSNVHAIICGRAGFEWGFEEDDDGEKELIKTGVKMKAESEVGFEPSLLIEMQRVGRAPQVTADPATHGWMNRAIVLKDRSNRINGSVYDFGGKPGEPLKFEPILRFIKPHLDCLNLGGEHLGVDTSRTSEGLFDGPESRSDRKRRFDVLMELIPDVMIRADIGGTSKESKRAQVEAMNACFGTSSWTAVKSMRIEDIEVGYRALLARFNLPESTATLPDPGFDAEMARQAEMDRGSFTDPLPPEPADALPFV